MDLLRLVYEARMLQGLKNGLRWFDLLGYLYFEIMDELFRDDLSDKTTVLLTLGTVLFILMFELFTLFRSFDPALTSKLFNKHHLFPRASLSN